MAKPPEIRLLKAEEIECRISVIKEKGLSLVLYKDARVDQKILDEVFGVFGWKREHECIDGNLYCTVSVKNNESGEWISKQDVGTKGMAEQEKSQASDSFKRACFNIGIGRELYSAPFIWISAIHSPIRIDEKDGKYVCYNKFHVSRITYDENREIEGLKIANETGTDVFSWSKEKKYVKTDADMLQYDNKETKDAVDAIRKKEHDLSEEQLTSLKKELRRTGVTQKQVKERYEIKDIKVMSQLTYQKVMKALSITETRGNNKAA